MTAGEGIEQASDDPEALLPIRTLHVVENNLSSVELARERVVEEMQTSVQRGLTDLVRLSLSLTRVSHTNFS